jgi:hypothetical protein
MYSWLCVLRTAIVRTSHILHGRYHISQVESMQKRNPCIVYAWAKNSVSHAASAAFNEQGYCETFVEQLLML